jgi:Peptidase family M28
VIDLRLWRISLIAVPLATLLAMFSLEDVPQPLEPGLPPDAFDGEAAVELTRELANSASAPRPGSDADDALAELVKARFASIEGATVAEQRFDATFAGEDVELRNVILILPGQSERQVALIAGRDAADGAGATTSIASTAAMLEAAAGFSGSTHRKTLVFVSTDGDSIGALGSRRFVRDYSDTELLDGAIVLSQPAAAEPTPPLVIPWSTGPQSTASQLTETAIANVSKETGIPAGDEGPLDDLYRLAIPSGLGSQGPLIRSGLDALRISSSGEPPPGTGEDAIDSVNAESLDNFGRAALSLMLALDTADEEIEHGPDAYIGLAGNLLPGWTIAALALALLIPVGITAGAGLASSARSPAEAARGILWTFVRVLPFLAALAVIYLTALVGLMPSPEFPFDTQLERLGTGGTIAVFLAIAAYAGCAFFLRPLAPPPPRAAATASTAALLLAAGATFLILLGNPYLAVLIALGLQLWVLAAARVAPGRLATAGLVLGGLLPPLAAVADLAGRSDVGLGVWTDLLLMLTGGQLSGTLALLGCVLAGVGVSLVAVARPGPRPPAPAMRLEASAPETAPGGPPEEEPEEPPGGKPEQPAPEEPQSEEEDSRLWSKPAGSSSPPPGRLRPTPSPSLT